MPEIKMYTLDEVAEILKVSKRTLYNYLKAGTLPAVKMGKSGRVTEQSLQSCISGLSAPAGTIKSKGSD